VSEKPQPRVLHIGKYLPPVPGGIETYLGDLLRVSMRQGLEVGAVVHGKQGHPDPNPADFGGAKIYTVPTYGQVLYAPVAPMFPWVLRSAINEFKPDILHMHVPNTSAFWALFIPEAQKIPWVLHWHADVDVGQMSFAMWAAYRAYKPFENALLRKSKLVIATSEEYLAASMPLRPWRDKCEVIPLAIDPERMVTPTAAEIVAAGKLWPRPDEPRFLAVGRLTYYKGYDSLIRAFADTPVGSLVIVGDGELRSSLELLIAELNLSDRVILIGLLPAASLAGCFSVADVFCMTSIDRSEAFGLVLLEAAYFGCRIVAFDTPGSGIGAVTRCLGGDIISASSWLESLSSVKTNINPNRRLPPQRLSSFLMSADAIDAWVRRYERLAA
jgi:glycosyltransferase involved in cell wall biosynthesis